MGRLQVSRGAGRHVRRYVLGTASIIPFLALGLSHAAAQPVGASVVAGQAQVLSSGANTIVNQNSAKAIINWQDFSVGQGASVQFNQPNSSAITLNRVTGTNLSTIDGAIRANGQVWLLNPNGVLFGNNARINVGGLLATTSDLANQDFLEGRYNFSGGGNGEIVNNGKIRAHGGGSVILSAPRVTNRGLISARTGRVVLGGTDTFTVDFNGDRLLSYAVGASTQTGKVSNSGTVKAQGGQILMTARAASGVQDAVINNTGMAEATSARSVNGEIILDAGEGAATNAGTLNASGRGAGETGGTVKVLGRIAAVPDNAAIDVSGSAGGGTVMIGGNFQGKGSEQHSQATNIGKARIAADAIQSGNGGKVAVWSDGRTDFAGSITARGGAGGGNGGQVETSGNTLNIPAGAYVSTLAPYGKTGNWLLDPHTIFIVNGGNDSATGQTFGNSPQVDANIDPGNIDAALRSTNLTLQAATDIIFQNDLVINGAGTAGRTLTLQAGRTIDLGTSALNYAAGNVVMIANDPGGFATGFRDNPTTDPGLIRSSGGAITAASLDLIMSNNGAPNTVGTIGTSGNPVVVTGATPTYITTPNKDVFITTGAGGIFHFAIGNSAHTNGVDIGTGNLNLIVNGSQQTAPIRAGNVNVSLPSGITSGNPINWDNPGNFIQGTLSIAARGRDSSGGNFVSVVDSADLILGSVTVSRNTTGDTGSAGIVSIQVQGGALDLQSAIVTESLVKLSAADNIRNLGGLYISAPQVSLSSSFGSIGSATAPINLTSSSSVAVQASTPSTGLINISSDKPTTVGLSGPFGITGGNVTLTTTAAPFGISQASGAAGTINASTATFTSAGSINLNTAPNTIGTVNLNAASSITFFNSGNLTINNVRANVGSNNASGLIDIQATGALTLSTSSSGATIAGSNGVFLHAGGNLLQGGSDISIAAAQASLLSDNGTLGTQAQPLNVNTSALGARTANKDMYFNIGSFNNGASLSLFNALNIPASGLITAISALGINAGTGNAQILASSAIAITSPSSGSIAANNLRVAGASFSASSGNLAIKSFSANTSGAITLNNNGALQINNLTGGVGIVTAGNVSLTATSGSITQAAGTAGSILAPSLFGGTVTAGDLILANPLNAVASVTFSAVGNIVFFNSVNTTLARASYNPNGFGSAPASAAQSVDIEVFGPGRTLTIGGTANSIDGTSIKANFVNLRATGNIIQSGGGTISATTLSLISDTGSIGSTTGAAPILRGVSALAARAAGDITLFSSFASAPNSLNIGAVVNPGPTGGSVSGITAGGNISLSLGAFDVFGSDAIKGQSLAISGNSIQLNSVAVNSLAARSQGTIDISAQGNIVINNSLFGVQTTVTSTQVVNGVLQPVQTTLTNTFAGIQTTGNVFLNTDNGTITQASGGGGAISAGSLSVFGANGVTLLNSANAITGEIDLGSLGDASLYNSIYTRLGYGAAKGTFFVQSGGDLELLKVADIASQVSGGNIDDPIAIAALNGANLHGSILSLKTGGDGIVLVTPGRFVNNFGANALLTPATRFLVYSADPATDVFNGLRTPGQGVFGATYPTAVTATGNRYVFSVANSTNTDFVGGDGLSVGSSTAQAPALAAFIVGLQPPPHNTPPPPPPPARADVLQIRGFAPPPPPPPPPPRNSPLADLAGPNAGNAEPPSASDQATSYVVSSLDGGPPPVVGGSGGGGTIIPRYLTAQPTLPSGTLNDPSQLPAFGNSALWQ